MLIGFLIRSRDEWVEWRRSVKHVQGKAVIAVADRAITSSDSLGQGELVDEVESLSEDDDEDDLVMVPDNV
jgi:cysteine protease ATG4